MKDRATIRKLTHDDLPAAFEMSYEAGWNQTREDWRRLLMLAPDGCFGCDCGGRLVATTTLLCHGEDLAWLGMVLTHRDFRKRGYARRLITAALDFADHRGIRSVKLDATDQGRPVYLSLGFEDEQPVERLCRKPGPLASPQDMFSRGVPDAQLDREAFGADRGRFLAALGEAQCFDGGFVMQREGSRARYLGPCISRDLLKASSAIRAVIASHPVEPWFWDILPKQRNAVDLARILGFIPVRQLTRMRRGAAITTNDHLVYAMGGFEAG